MRRRLAAVLLVCAFLPLAGCAEERVAPLPSLHAFSALYGPIGDGESGFEVTLEPARPLADRDLVERAAYGMTIKGHLEWATRHALDATFSLVRIDSCPGDPTCNRRSLSWPVEATPAAYGIGWPAAVPPDATVSREGDLLVLERAGTRYEYEGDRLAPSRIVPMEEDEDGPSGYRLVAYDVEGALGPADAWPASPALLPEETQPFLVHPGEDADFLGLGWTTRDAIDHLKSDPEAARILADGGCVVSYSVRDLGVQPLVSTPVFSFGNIFVGIALKDRDNVGSEWHFTHQANLPTGPRFTDPGRDDSAEGDTSSFTCVDHAVGPTPRLSMAEAWDRSKLLVEQPDSRRFAMEVHHEDIRASSHFVPAMALQANIVFFPLDGNGGATSMLWDLERGSVLELVLSEDDTPGPP